MSLTEDAIRTMPPEQQKTIEQKIAGEVVRRLGLGDAGKDQVTSTDIDTTASNPLVPGI